MDVCFLSMFCFFWNTEVHGVHTKDTHGSAYLLKEGFGTQSCVEYTQSFTKDMHGSAYLLKEDFGTHSCRVHTEFRRIF